MTSSPVLLAASPQTPAGTNTDEAAMPRPSRWGQGAGWGSLSCRGFVLLFLYFLCQTCYAFPSALISPCLDEFASAFHMDKESLAASPSLSCGVTIIASFLSGWLLDAIERRCKIGRSCKPCQRRIGHIMLSLSMIGMGAFYFLIPFTPPHFSWFLIVQTFGSIFVAFVNVISTTLCIRLGTHTEKEMARRDLGTIGSRTGAFTGACVSIVHVGVGAGGVLAPLAANLSNALGEKRMLAYMWLAPLIFVIVICVNILSPPPHDGNEGDSVSHSVLGSVNEGSVIAKSLQVGLGESSRAIGDSQQAGEDREHLVSVTSDKPFDVAVFVMLLVCMAFAEGAIYGPVPYMVSVLHSLGFTEDNASLVFSAGSFGLSGGRLVLSFIGARFMPSQILLVMLPLALIFNFGQCLLATTSLIAKPGWPMALFVTCYVCNAVGSSCAYAWLLALYSSCQPVNGMVNGMALVAISAGMVLCVNLDGYFYKHVGAASVFIVNACVGLVGVCAVVFFHIACKRATQRHSEMLACRALC